MERKFNLAVTILFCAVIFAVPILTKFEKTSDFSPYENRALAAPPAFSVDALFNGDYLSAWDEYYSDHIWKRNGFLKAYVFLDMNVFKRPVVNEVVVLKDKLLPFVAYTDKYRDSAETMDFMAGRLEELDGLVSGYGGNFVFIGVPEQMSMLRAYYPSYLNDNGIKLSLREEGLFSRLSEKGVGFINMREEYLKHEDYASYYSSVDHHYNIFGAYLVYQTLLEKINAERDTPLPVLTEDSIEFASLPNPFYGSRNRKLYNGFQSAERLYLYAEKEALPFQRWDNGNEVYPSVFSLPADGAVPVSYGLYMGGDIAETIIDTSRPELPNALVFGDSFTNPFETFLYHSFNVTVSLDMRYYDKKTIMEYIAEHKPDYVFCLRDDTSYLLTVGNGDIK